MRIKKQAVSFREQASLASPFLDRHNVAQLQSSTCERNAAGQYLSLFRAANVKQNTLAYSRDRCCHLSGEGASLISWYSQHFLQKCYDFYLSWGWDVLPQHLQVGNCDIWSVRDYLVSFESNQYE
jgi:hypothetical protein